MKAFEKLVLLCAVSQIPGGSRGTRTCQLPRWWFGGHFRGSINPRAGLEEGHKMHQNIVHWKELIY